MKWFLCLLISGVCVAATDKGFLKAHNDIRKSKGIAPFIWDQQLALFADDWAKHLAKRCKIVHSDSVNGENLAQTWGPTKTAKEVVAMWASEEKNYNYTLNKCKINTICGHYTQIVWRNSLRLGCAAVKCLTKPHSTVYVCQYDPAGNWRGHWPY